MFVPRIDGLRAENWRNLSLQERLGELQNLEDALAIQENRTPCNVNFIPDEVFEYPEDRQTLRGYHDGKGIFVNEELVKDYKPYLATETLFHEARHDYQENLSKNPEIGEDPGQLQDFQMNYSGGYLTSKKDGYVLYRWQPIEKDANEVARQRSDELYGNEFDDKTLYPEYRQKMEQERSDDIALGKEYLGDHYVENAREKMISRYQEIQSLNQHNGHLSDKPLPGEVKDTASLGMRASPESEEPDRNIKQYPEQTASDTVRGESGSVAGNIAGEATSDEPESRHEPVSQSAQFSAEDLSPNTTPESAEHLAESAGEITGETAGDQAGVAVGKVAGEAAKETRGAVEDGVGQSTEAPTNAIENAADEAPSSHSEADEEQYYGYTI